jgi:hypothetical protein
MTTDTKPTELERHSRKVVYRNGASGAVYGFGLIGALVYYIGHATTFWLGVLGFFKAIVWPAMLIYQLLNYLHM